MTLESYVWPGGYPVLYLDDENETLCPGCAQIHTDLGGKVSPFVFYEGPTDYCADCNEPQKSAYGDPAQYDDIETPKTFHHGETP